MGDGKLPLRVREPAYRVQYQVWHTCVKVQRTVGSADRPILL